MEPMVTRTGGLGMQICIPSTWTDEQALQFGERENPCGTTLGWSIRREGSELLQGKPERNPCKDRDGFVHVMLDA